jgi:hypothetical protein
VRKREEGRYVGGWVCGYVRTSTHAHARAPSTRMFPGWPPGFVLPLQGTQATAYRLCDGKILS